MSSSKQCLLGKLIYKLYYKKCQLYKFYKNKYYSMLHMEKHIIGIFLVNYQHNIHQDKYLCICLQMSLNIYLMGRMNNLEKFENIKNNLNRTSSKYYQRFDNKLMDTFVDKFEDQQHKDIHSHKKNIRLRKYYMLGRGMYIIYIHHIN